MLVVLVEPINGILLALEAFSLFSIPVGACGAETTLPREAEEAKSKARGDATESLVDVPRLETMPVASAQAHSLNHGWA